MITVSDLSAFSIISWSFVFSSGLKKIPVFVSLSGFLVSLSSITFSWCFWIMKNSYLLLHFVEVVISQTIEVMGVLFHLEFGFCDLFNRVSNPSQQFFLLFFFRNFNRLHIDFPLDQFRLVLLLGNYLWLGLFLLVAK